MSVINTATNTVIATITVGTDPGAVAVTPDGARAYVTNSGSGSVSVINTATNTVIATITVGLGPGRVAVSSDGTRAYVTNSGSDSVSVIDTATNTVTATITVGSHPLGVAVATVTIINAAPIATADAYSVIGGATLSVPAPGVLANDSDADGDVLTADLVSAPTRGTLVLNSDGSFSLDSSVAAGFVAAGTSA